MKEDFVLDFSDFEWMIIYRRRLFAWEKEQHDQLINLLVTYAQLKSSTSVKDFVDNLFIFLFHCQVLLYGTWKSLGFPSFPAFVIWKSIATPRIKAFCWLAWWGLYWVSPSSNPVLFSWWKWIKVQAHKKTHMGNHPFSCDLDSLDCLKQTDFLEQQTIVARIGWLSEG